MPLQVAMMVMNEQTEPSQGLLPTVAELALSGRTLPMLTRAVVVGEALRRAVLAVHRVPSVTLAGKDADGTPLIWQHRHAHYVADCRGAADPVHGGPLRITHVVVYAPGGLTPSEVTALLGVRYLPSYVSGTEVAETEPLAVTLGGLGQVAGLHAWQAQRSAHHTADPHQAETAPPAATYASLSPLAAQAFGVAWNQPVSTVRRHLRTTTVEAASGTETLRAGGSLILGMASARCVASRVRADNRPSSAADSDGLATS